VRARVLVGLVVVVGMHAPALAAPDDAPLADGPAVAGAVAAGAALRAEGDALGKAGKYELALARFRAAAGQFPSATHDCYVALTYFRLGGLTAARAYLDSAHRRGDEVPGWCAGRLEDQLTAELARRAYLAVAVTVTPADAIVAIGDLRVRGGRQVWLAPGPVTVTSARAGFDPQRQDATIPATAPARGVAIALHLARHVDAPVHHRPWLAYGALAVGGALAAGGAVMHATALDTRAAAQQFYAKDPRFAPLDARFQLQRALALGGYAAGAVAIAAGVYLLIRARGAEHPLAVAVGPASVLVSVTGGW
jgi:tetratricopeptide (TPR) repeat protein